LAYLLLGDFLEVVVAQGLQRQLPSFGRSYYRGRQGHYNGTQTLETRIGFIEKNDLPLWVNACRRLN